MKSSNSDLQRPVGASTYGRLIAALGLVGLALAQPGAVPLAWAQEVAPATLKKFVILSRHGVRSPIPEPSELASWTASEQSWPTWRCANGKECERGQLTPRGQELATQMGAYYRRYLASFLPETADKPCPVPIDPKDPKSPNELFLWADVGDERTRDTGLALLRGFRPGCDSAAYFHTQAPKDPIFHSVAGNDCKLDPIRAEQDMMHQAKGSLSGVLQRLQTELATAQKVLRCCQPELCQATWKMCPSGLPQPEKCRLDQELPTCLVPKPTSSTPTQVQLGGALRIASTFAEILLLEYANGFKNEDVGWGKVTREQMTPLFRLHTTAFDIEQRTPYVAALQGSPLLRRILLALQVKHDKDDDKRPGVAPAGTRFVAYIGHDTNIANIGGMLDLHWQQPGYQQDQMPPAGALTFELREEAGARNVYVAYVAQSLDDMRNRTGERPVRTPVSVPGCSSTAAGFPCPFDALESLVKSKLDPNCSQ